MNSWPNRSPEAQYFSGETSTVIVSQMREETDELAPPSCELLVGNVLRRLCARYGDQCRETCQREPSSDMINPDKSCADLNLKKLVDSLGIKPKNLLMVGATADNVGFCDQIESYGDKVKTNSVNVRELPGYNAFFARTSENIVLGARFADCSYIAINFQDETGEAVYGFVHLTRTNMQGESAFTHQIGGKKVGSFEYFLDGALSHYGGKTETVQARLIAGIDDDGSVYHFKDGEALKECFPGWWEQKCITNASNPDCSPGQQFNPQDIWRPKYRSMVRWLVERSGVRLDVDPGVINPAQLHRGHASNHHGTTGAVPNGRDAYFIMPSASNV